MIKISIPTLIGIIKICGRAAKNSIIEDTDYIADCKKLISEYMGLPDMFNVTNS